MFGSGSTTDDSPVEAAGATYDDRDRLVDEVRDSTARMIESAGAPHSNSESPRSAGTRASSWRAEHVPSRGLRHSGDALEVGDSRDASDVERALSHAFVASAGSVDLLDTGQRVFDRGALAEVGNRRLFLAFCLTVADFLSDPCAFYETGPLVAEGLIEMRFESADDSLVGPGVNSWGLRLKGILEDTAGECASGKVEYQLLRRWIQHSAGPDFDIDKVTALKGPSLTCTR